MTTPATSRWHGLWLAQTLGLVLLAFSYLRIAGDTQSMVFSSQVLDVLFAGPIWGTALGYNLLYFALTVLFLHALYATVCWLVGRMSALAWPTLKATPKQHILIWFVVLTFGLLANNAAMFVESSLGQPYARAMGVAVWGTPLGRVIWLVCFGAAVLACLLAARRWWREGSRPTRLAWATVAMLVVACVGLNAYRLFPVSTAQRANKPNIVLIGLDSLRADLLDPAKSPGVTPHVDAFMKEGTLFTNAVTPLARTFPSMMSMLTGRHPHHSGAVMNLLPRELIDDKDSLPRLLTEAGYHAAYVTDEVRFSNIDASYGFSQTILPPIGASEFLIGKVADTPVSNLLVNTRLGGWLFPHVHANRGAATTYDPDVFVERVDRELRATQPVFLTVHLTLGHWPYTWAGSPVKARDPNAVWPEYYLHAVERLDQQFAALLALLQKKGILENAIVVVYSDHGEAFDSPHEALVPDKDPLVEALNVAPSWGHGTTVLTAHQFRIVLGMRHMGSALETWKPGRRVGAPVTFEDVAPTLVDALGLPANSRFDGRSLVPLLIGRANADSTFAGRVRFTETEYQPQGLASQEGSVSASTFSKAISVYHIDRETDRIEVKRNRLGSLLLDREYAAIGDSYLVGAFPSLTGPGHDYLAVPLSGGAPRQLFAEPSADEPELRILWTALHAEFGAVLDARRQSVAADAVANR